MSRITLVTGGAASGKSFYACEQAGKFGPNVLFMATCVPRDEEMLAKVERHRKQRPSTWTTVEVTRNLPDALEPKFDAAVVDCLTLFVAQMLVDNESENVICAEVSRLCERPPCPLFIVTNEVGWGIVPDNAEARRFRELQGAMNRLAAARCNQVILMVSGIPVWIKGNSSDFKSS